MASLPLTLRVAVDGHDGAQAGPARRPSRPSRESSITKRGLHAETLEGGAGRDVRRRLFLGHDVARQGIEVEPAGAFLPACLIEHVASTDGSADVEADGPASSRRPALR